MNGENSETRFDLVCGYIVFVPTCSTCLFFQNDAKAWIENALKAVQPVGTEDTVIPESKILIRILDEVTQVITPIEPITDYFSNLGIDYFKEAAFVMEGKVGYHSVILQ